MTPLNDCAFFLIIIYYEFNYRLSLFVQWPTFCENPFDLLAHSALLYYSYFVASVIVVPYGNTQIVWMCGTI